MSSVRTIPRFLAIGAAIVFVALSLLVFLPGSDNSLAQGQGGTPTRLPEGLIGKEEAAEIVISEVVNPIWERADQRNGLRTNQYGQLLPPGTEIEPAGPVETDEPLQLVCENQCWLFFIDELPLAHFGHPVQIVLLDAETRELMSIQTEWWPLINGTPVFDKIGNRTDPETIIFDKTPGLVAELHESCGMNQTCEMWAIIVCGYDDLPDTFDEDTEGMYQVLRNLFIPDDHIFFVSPHTTHTGVDRPTSIANVQWAINQVASQADANDKVLFFYSSHGGIDSLSCVPGSPGGGYISAADLDNWLDAITSDELSIIIEACHSGSLIGRYANGTYVASEDDLTGDGETNRTIFTSASTDTSSYPDVDSPGDPNPGDSGSETIWGYVEAFSVPAADTNGDGDISFGEGWQYAWDNDITRINGWNTPQMDDTGLNADHVYNYFRCTELKTEIYSRDHEHDDGTVPSNSEPWYHGPDLWVRHVQDGGTAHQNPEYGQTNYVYARVHNIGCADAENVTVDFSWVEPTGWSNPAAWNYIDSATIPSLPATTAAVVSVPWSTVPLPGDYCLHIRLNVADDLENPDGRAFMDNNKVQINVSVEDTWHGAGWNWFFFIENGGEELVPIDLVFDTLAAPSDTAIRLLLPPGLKFESVEGAEILQGEDEWTILDFPARVESPVKIVGVQLDPGQKQRAILTLTLPETTEIGEEAVVTFEEHVEGETMGGIQFVSRNAEPETVMCSLLRKKSTVLRGLAEHFGLDLAAQAAEFSSAMVESGECQDEDSFVKGMRESAELESAMGEQVSEIAPEYGLLYIKATKRLLEAVSEGDLSAIIEAQQEVLLYESIVLADALAG
jgi:hypothetical protein